jgi:hypothetical protein
MSRKTKTLTDDELKAISEQSSVDIDVLRSWYKGLSFFPEDLFDSNQIGKDSEQAFF